MRALADRDRVELAALLIAGLGLVAIAGALAFEHLGGLPPCPLCLEQRFAYYAGIPLALLAFGAARLGHEKTARLALGLVALAFLANAGLGAFHAGVEWGWWPGPQDCAGGSGLSAPESGSLLDRLRATRVVRCDEAAWRLFGLSLAGYNALVSLALAVIAGIGALSARR